ncbi:MAG: hypothetical protein OXG52_08535 [bacterium]|nr:hypothetical protein [bacterium]
MVLGVLGGAVAALVLAHLVGRAHTMAGAQTAADAAALAGALGGQGAAADIAAANGAVLGSFAAAGGSVRVEVALGGERAVAAAAVPAAEATPALAAALDRLTDVLGPDAAAEVRLLGPLGAEGIEAPRHVAARLAALSHRTGLCRAGDGRPLHFVLCPATHRQ